jgi:hypothetical protein
MMGQAGCCRLIRDASNPVRPELVDALSVALHISGKERPASTARLRPALRTGFDRLERDREGAIS